jgi:hypothetical protein
MAAAKHDVIALQTLNVKLHALCKTVSGQTRDEGSFSAGIPTTDLMIGTLFPSSNIDKVEKRPATAKARNERSQLVHIFQFAISYKCDCQALQVCKCFYQDIQLV